MKPYSYRNTWAEVSLDAIHHNVQLFTANLSKDCSLMAVVKADGYGHGAVDAASAAIQAGAAYLGVALVDEALQLRASGIEHPILVLGYTPAHAMDAAIQGKITMTISSREQLDELGLLAARYRQQARVHLKVDTGMSRLGFTTEEVPRLFDRGISPHLDVEGLFTHFADADNIDPTFTWEQFRRFVALTEHLARRGIHIPIKHCCNSAAAMKYPDMHLDMVRVGISMYGLSPLNEGERQVYAKAYPLEEAMQLKTTVSFLKKVEQHQPISYSLTYRTEEESLIATLPVGYADGLSRLLSNKGSVLVRGTRAPIRGKVCMDQIMIDVTTLAGVQLGEEVVIFGMSEGAHLSILEFASLMQTISYEVVCLVGKRVPRVYVRDNEIVRVSNPLLG
jgi:alanine racemase